MANIILITDQDQEQTLAGVSKLVTRSTDGEAVFSAEGQGGGNIDFGLTVGEVYKTIYFNTVHDTATLDAALAAADYPNMLPFSGDDGVQYPSNTLLAFDDSTQAHSQMPRLDIVDMSSIVAGAYAIWYTQEGLARSVVYCTANVNLNASRPISKGWASKWIYINTIRYEATLSSVLNSFAGIKDVFFASSPQAYGSFLSKEEWNPRITVVPTGNDLQFELNDTANGITGVELRVKSFTDAQYTNELVSLLDGKLKVLALPDTIVKNGDSVYIINSWSHNDAGITGMAGFWMAASGRYLENTTTAAEIFNPGTSSVKFSFVWNATYGDSPKVVYPGIIQVGSNVRVGMSTLGPYTVTQTLGPGERLLVAVTSGEPGSGFPDPSKVGRMTITLTDFAEIT